MADLLNIYSVNPTGMFSFGRCADYVLRNKGMVHLLGHNADKGGDSNGSGKSSLFNALCEVLFGENPTGEKGDSIVNSVWDKGMAGRVLFTNWQGDHYRVTYCRKWKEQFYPSDVVAADGSHIAYVGTSIFFEKHENGVWIDQRGNGMPDTRKKILETIGLSYDRFLAIAYMSPRIGDQFLRGTNKDRMDILSGITGIEEWDRILDRCRKKKKSLGLQITDLDKKAERERGAVETLREQLQSAQAFDWDQHIKSLEEQLRQSRGAWAIANKNSQALSAQITALEVEQSNSYDQEKIVKLNKKIEELTEELRKNELVLSRPVNIEEDSNLRLTLNGVVTQLSQAQFAYTNKQSEGVVSNPPVDKKLEDAVTEANAGRDKSQGALGALLGESGDLLSMKDCPTCGSRVTKVKKDKIQEKIDGLQDEVAAYEGAASLASEVVKVARDKMVSDLENRRQLEMVDLQVKIKELEANKCTWESALQEDKSAKLVKADENRAEVTLVVTGLRNKIQGIRDDIQKESEVYQQFDATLKEHQSRLPAFQQEMNDHQAAGVNVQAQVDQANVSLENIKVLESQIKEKGREVKFFDDEILQVRNDLSVYLWLIDNIPAIKLHKMSVAMAEISDLANSYFSDMGDSLRVSITSFEEKTKKKNAADIKDLMKSEVNIEVTDGIKNISPKLYSDGEVGRISLAIIRALHEMARKSGQGCNLMLMDEIFSFVDMNNSQRIADFFSKLMKRGTVVVTDNSGKVNDLLKFDNVWTVTKTNGQSVLEV